jgi:acetyl-CoA acetyltransferase
MSIDHLGLDHAKVNPNGGAIALGHVRAYLSGGLSTL